MLQGYKREEVSFDLCDWTSGLFLCVIVNLCIVRCVGGKRPYLQSPPVLGAVGGDDDAVLLGRPEAQRQSEVLAVLVHPVQEPQVGLPVETQGRLCRAA